MLNRVQWALFVVIVFSSTLRADDERKSYHDIIAGTETLKGLLTFHKKPGSLHLELTIDQLDSPLAFAAVQVSGGGDFSVRSSSLDTQLVRWQRVGDHLILAAVRESGGVALAVTDASMAEGQHAMASQEGIFPAPEGGATVAAVRQMAERGEIQADERVVLFNTGTGLKYP